MKAVILAGGLGSRLEEETDTKPKPMVNIGERPMLWHIMKIYASFGVTDFIVCLGYKGYYIKEYFSNYFLHTSDVTFGLANNEMIVHRNQAEDWKVTLVDTGADTMTGGRLKRVAPYVADETAFCLTYGDGVANINISDLIAFHKQRSKLATMTAVQPPGRFGSLTIKDARIEKFEEKPVGDGAWINGGFFVLSPKAIEYVANDSTVWEQEPLRNLAKDGQLDAFEHSGFWQCMDTLRDKNYLQELWEEGRAPWKVW